MAYSGMLRRETLVITDVLEELSASIIRVTKIGILGTLAVASNRHRLLHRSLCRLLVTSNVPGTLILVTLMMEELSSSEASVLRRATRRNIQKYAILHK
jgi:hypothetical protein